MPGAAATLITTPFDRESTAAEVVEGVGDSLHHRQRRGDGRPSGADRLRQHRRLRDDVGRLHDVLASAEGARIVSVSSSGHLRSPVVFDDLDYAFREYDPLLEGVGGRYFDDCNEAPVVHRRPEFGMGGVAFYAVDPAMRGGSGRFRSA